MWARGGPHGGATGRWCRLLAESGPIVEVLTEVVVAGYKQVSVLPVLLKGRSCRHRRPASAKPLRRGGLHSALRGARQVIWMIFFMAFGMSSDVLVLGIPPSSS